MGHLVPPQSTTGRRDLLIPKHPELTAGLDLWNEDEGGGCPGGLTAEGRDFLASPSHSERLMNNNRILRALLTYRARNRHCRDSRLPEYVFQMRYLYAVCFPLMVLQVVIYSFSVASTPPPGVSAITVAEVLK